MTTPPAALLAQRGELSLFQQASAFASEARLGEALRDGYVLLYPAYYLDNVALNVNEYRLKSGEVEAIVRT